MEQALRHLQRLHAAAAAAAAAAPGGGGAKGAGASAAASKRPAAAAHRLASARLYDLLAALDGAMDAVAYLSALRELAAAAGGGEDEALRRRALRLLAARVDRLGPDVEDAALLPAALGDKGAADARVRALARAAMAVCDLLPEVLAAPGAAAAASASSPSPLTRQAALLAADAAVRRFGAREHPAVLRCAPAVVAAARDASAPAAVRGSALACLASAVAAARQRWLPLLPGTAAAVLGAAADARAALADPTGPQARAIERGAAQVERDDDEEEEEEEEAEQQQVEEEGGAATTPPAAADAALLLAGALAALQAMYGALGAFMSPYVPDTLALLTDPVVLAAAAAAAAGREEAEEEEEDGSPPAPTAAAAVAKAVAAANVPGAAARLRAALPAAVPPRLLLDPLVDQWDGALAACGAGGGGTASSAPAVALLAIAREAAARMDARAAAAHHDALFDLVLRALDTRQRWLLELAGGTPETAAAAGTGADRGGGGGASADPPPSAPPPPPLPLPLPLSARLSDADVHAVEHAAVQTLLAVVMKLSEARFRPLFLRLVEWASAAATAAAAAAEAGAASSSLSRRGRDRDRAAAAAVGGLGRAVALLSAVVGLSGRLRAVFTPYYRHVLDLAVAQLQAAAGGEIEAEGARASKQQQQQPPQQPPKKKQRKQAAAVAAAAATAAAAAAGAADGVGASPASDALALAAWLARNRSVRALHLLFAHDPSGAFVDAARLEALLPPLAAQLRAEPPLRLRARLAAQDAARELDATLVRPPCGGERARRAEEVVAASPHGSPLDDASGGRAVVAAIAQMAASAPQAAREAAWRQINRAALLATRRDASGGGGLGPAAAAAPLSLSAGAAARARLRAACLACQLVARLREEYLSFLPEALPYVAELLEDSDAAVAAAGQALAAALEEASGEALDDYLRA
jgi:U3 small nucleolar RNA-associated protein 10